MTKHETTTVKTQKINMLMTQLKNLQKELTINLNFIAQRAKVYYNKTRFEEIDLKMKEKTFLLKKHQDDYKKRQVEPCQN